MDRIITRFNQNFIIIACRNLSVANIVKVKRSFIKSQFSGTPALLIVLSLTLFSCKGGTKELDETPTRGDIRIIADESFQPLVDTEVFTFTQLYTSARIKPLYKPEFDVINDFMNDSAKVIVTSKRLSDDQIKYLRDSLIVARTISFAWDALTLVTNKGNNDTLLKYNDVRDVFLGIKNEWKDLDPKSDLGTIRVIFDNTKSGNIRYFKELFEIEGNLPANFFAVNSNLDVIDFVTRNPDALGIVSKNWISDKDDPQSRRYIKKVNVTGISKQYINDGSYYRPDQGSIVTKDYPFVREIYLISRETFSGLGSGFIQWGHFASRTDDCTKIRFGTSYDAH
ncbi:MAG: substrate-binding domain-containing protein [Bacteroidota bacterium]